MYQIFLWISDSSNVHLYQGKKEAGLLKPGADVAVFKDIAAEAERLDIKENKAVMVIVELLLDDNIIKQVNFL